MTLAARSFYVAGGTLPRDAPSYVVRRADNELLEGLLERRFCYVLTSRQMGKSSLMVRTAGRLRQQGVTCAVLDLTAIGQDLTREQWYDGLQNALGRQLGLEEELDAFWLARARLSPLQRWMLALEEIVIPQFGGPVVLFLDEIDAVRSLPFAADEFFAGIREFYNRRAECPALERLTFCLLGVASPSDLIRDTRTTPFNIGLRIDLTDFTREEAAPLSYGLAETWAPDARHLLDRVLYWTGGHPYLTQRLCHAVSTQEVQSRDGMRIQDNRLVDVICRNLLASAQARVQNDNLLFVRDRLLRSEVNITRLLGLYESVLRGRHVQDDESDPLITVLRLSGITRPENGRLYVRNRIYARVFDRSWVAENLPDSEGRRQRAAYRSGALRATALFGAVIVALAALGYTAKREADSARQASGRLRIALKQADSALGLAEKEAGRTHQAETYLAAALKKSEERRQEAERQKGIAAGKQADAENARRETTARLRDSYLAQAQAIRWSGRVGHKFDSLAALEKAAGYPASREFRMRLRDEAIAAMALPIDLRPLRARQAGIHGSLLVIDENGRRAAAIDEAGTACIWDLSAGKILHRFPGAGEPASRAEFSRDGRFLALYDRNGARARLLDLHLRVTALNLPLKGIGNPVLHPDSRSLLVISENGSILRRNLLTSVEIVLGRGSGGSRARLRPSPDGRWLAHYTSRANTLRVIDLAGGNGFSLEAKAGLIQVAWSPDSSRIAAATGDFGLVVWSVAEKKVLSQMGGHLAYPERLTFLRECRLLAASGYDPTLRIWDVATGRQVLSIPIGGFAYRFSADGRRLHFAGNGQIREYEVDPGMECRVFPHTTGVGSHGVDFLKGSSLMVTGAEDGLRFWDVLSGREAAWLPTGSSSQAFFSYPNPHLVRWDGVQNRISVSPVHWNPTINSVRIGRPIADRLAEPVAALRCSADGGQLIAGGDRGIAFFDLPRLGRKIAQQSHEGVSQVSVSSDRRWAASSGHVALDVRVWDLKSLRCVKVLSTGTMTNVAFSPDRKWLVTGNPQKFRFWRAGDWCPERDILRAPGMGLPGPIAFSADGKQVALGYSQSVMHLYDSASGTLLARLECPGENLVTPSPTFIPDNAFLATGTECGAVYLWDLRRIRSRLAKIGLDWDQTPLPTAHPTLPLRLVLDPQPSAQASTPGQTR